MTQRAEYSPGVQPGVGARRPIDRARLVGAGVSVAVAVALLVVKWLAYWITGSQAILSDAMESIVNIAAGGFALYSLIVSSRPPDARYPYGYGKIGYFSAGFEGGLITLAALAIFYEAIRGLLRPQPIEQLGVGLVLVAVASVVNLVLGRWLIRRGKRTASLILEADGRHVLTDSYTSFGVVLGVGLVLLTGWYWLDPLIAMVVAVIITWTGLSLVRESFKGLMDHADRDLIQKLVTALQSGRHPGWLDLHKLRAWQAGDRTFVDFHLVVPPDWNVKQIHEAHVEARRLIQTALEGPVESIIHFDPDEPRRMVDARAAWTLESATRDGNAPDIAPGGAQLANADDEYTPIKAASPSFSQK